MRILTFLFCALFMSLAFAETKLQTQIHDVDMGQVNEEPLIFLTSGHVVTFPDAAKSTMSVFKEAIQDRSWFSITINDQREIIYFEEIPAPVTEILPRSQFKSLVPPSIYEPSILRDLDHARSFFYEARTHAREESQCFNRAHVWTYEWRKNHNLYASKVWLFFTRRFIRKYRFEWWFHVAPMVHVITGNEVRERVMDIKYARGPLKLKQWTDIFMRDRADCPVVKTYSDHANFPESGSCFVMKSSMYYYQPADLEQLELTGNVKTKWNLPEVRAAYKDAFDVTFEGVKDEE